MGDVIQFPEPPTFRASVTVWTWPLVLIGLWAAWRYVQGRG